MCIKERNTSDSTCKKLLRDEGCFADLCNYAFFQGRQVIKPEELVSRENDLSTLIGNVDDPTEIKYVDEVLKLLSVMTGDRDYEKVICDEMKGQVKSMCDVAERLKNMGRQEERINAVKFAISLGASEEKILTQYSKEEYEKALALMKA